jgi:hypothetical protein
MRSLMDEFDVGPCRAGGTEVIMSKKLPGRAAVSPNWDKAAQRRES